MSKKILVVIPMYNCEKQIKRVLDEFDEKTWALVTTIRILDNRSTDKSIHNALDIINNGSMDKVCVFLNEENVNLGGTQKIAFQMAIQEEYDYVIILHGDNQARSDEVKYLIEQIQNDPYLDVVFGARFMSGSNLVGYSYLRIFGNVILNCLYSLVTRKKIYDLGSGLNLFSVRSLKRIDFMSCHNELHFNMQLLLDIVKKNIPFKYVPISWRDVDQVSNARIFKVGFKALTSLFFWKIGKRRIANRQSLISREVKQVK